jgi:hypothetical protein
MVPAGTYTGWNLRRSDAGAENELVSLVGSFIPFPATAAERQQSGDPRKSLAERYPTINAYVAQFEATCDRLQAGGYLLAEDAQRLVEVHRDRVSPLLPTARP